MALQDVLYILDQIGFTDVFLPFILIFTILFAVLQKINVFSPKGTNTDSRKYNSIIALAMSIGVIIPHSLNKYPPGTDIVDILNKALPNVSLLIVAALFLLVLLGLFGAQFTWGSGIIGGIVTLVSLGLITTIFGSAAGWWQNTGVLSFLQDPDIQATFLILIVFFFIISTITSDSKTNYMEETGKFFGWTPPPPPQQPQGGRTH